MYVSLRNSINASKTANYVFHYNAPVFIVVANKKEYGNAMTDSVCALDILRQDFLTENRLRERENQ